MNKTLIIMGTHPNGVKSFDWTRTDCDIWMFNEAPNIKTEKGKRKYPKCDACFQLHHEAIWKNPKNRSDEKHYQWLSSGKTPAMYMQKKYPDVPKSIEYPIHDVLSFTENLSIFVKGKKKKFKFFTSSPDFAFALVAKMAKEGKKYDKVEIHGIELETESEYRFQKTGFGFWIGYLTALGIKIELYNSIFDAPVYGYEGDVEIKPSEFESRINDLVAELGSGKDDYNRDAKFFIDNLAELHKTDISFKVKNDFNDLTTRGEKVGIIIGRIKENLRLLEKAKAMVELTGVSIFSMGEIEGTRISYNKQYYQVRSECVALSSQIDPLLKKILPLKKRSPKRKRALDEFGNKVAELMNKNMLLFHIVGAIKESQYYVDSIKLSFNVAKKEK